MNREDYQERMRRIERERKARERHHRLVMWGIVTCVLIFWAAVIFVYGHFGLKVW